MIDLGERINLLAQHPVATATAGVATATAGVTNKMFEYLPVMHEIFSYTCMSVGLLASIFGIIIQIRNWKSSGIQEEISKRELAIKDLELKRLQRKEHKDDTGRIH